MTVTVTPTAGNHVDAGRLADELQQVLDGLLREARSRGYNLDGFRQALKDAQRGMTLLRVDWAGTQTRYVLTFEEVPDPEYLRNVLSDQEVYAGNDVYRSPVNVELLPAEG